MQISNVAANQIAETTPQITSSTEIGEASSGAVFSDVFQSTLETELLENVLAIQTPSAEDSLGSFSTEGALISSMLSSASGEEISKEQVMAFMLLLMMKDMGGSGSTPIMGALASLLTSMGSDGSAISLSGLGSSYSRQNIGSYFTTPKVSGTGSAVVPVDAWVATSPGVVGNAGNRSASLLRQIIDQFDVENSGRYEPYKRGIGDTYCNIFVWDVTSALGCEIPHFVDPGTGEPRIYPDVSGAMELDANGTHDWLVNHGAAYGWREVSAAEAQAMANQGKPAVTAWKNPTGGAGHVQVVCPSIDGSYDPVRGASVAQAGSYLYNYAYVSQTFGAGKMPAVRYFVHD